MLGHNHGGMTRLKKSFTSRKNAIRNEVKQRKSVTYLQNSAKHKQVPAAGISSKGKHDQRTRAQMDQWFLQSQTYIRKSHHLQMLKKDSPLSYENFSQCTHFSSKNHFMSLRCILHSLSIFI